MKNIFLVLVLLSFISVIHAQEKARPYEFGYTLGRLSSFNNYYYHFSYGGPAAQLGNAVIFKYSKNRLAFRSNLGYSINHSKSGSIGICFDCETYNTRTTSFRLGIGGQYNFLLDVDWVYIFVDLGYRYQKSNGDISGGFSGGFSYFTVKQRGIESFIGSGAKIKIYKRLYMYPEVGYNPYYAKTSYYRSTSYNGNFPSEFYDLFFSPEVRLNFTMKF